MAWRYAEQLLKVNGDEIRTVALAGTQVFKEGEIIWESKEKEEQQFVTDFILDSLNDLVTVKIHTEPYTFRAGNIVHIKTDISGKIDRQKRFEKGFENFASERLPFAGFQRRNQKILFSKMKDTIVNIMPDF